MPLKFAERVKLLIYPSKFLQQILKKNITLRRAINDIKIYFLQYQIADYLKSVKIFKFERLLNHILTL